ncbi:hypothetical protein HYU13_01880, partial [Candidatus Woesearchaeota archaeon]|nr:hypothetical protein [Candidatus Woesearchaeota archaeon]
MSKGTISKGEVNTGTASNGTANNGTANNGKIGKGTIFRVAGPVIEAKNIDAKMYDVVIVGKERLMGEVIRIQEELTTIQVYEDTSNIKPGEDVEVTGMPLSVELGPGLLSSIYDGIQRPLPVLRDQMGDFIKRGVQAPGLDHKKKWEFKASAKKGDEVKGGAVIGTVEEMPGIVHKIMVKPDVHGKIESIKSGSFTVDEAVGELDDGTELKLFHQWPVRIPRPVAKKLMPETPLVTGQRVIDGLFPVAKGGVAAIPGPFGAGKCVTGDTKILVNNRLVEIKEVFRGAKGRAWGNKEETFVELDNPLLVWTFNGEKIAQSKATHAYKGKSSRIIY